MNKALTAHRDPLRNVALGAALIEVGFTRCGHDLLIDPGARYEYDVRMDPPAVVIWRVGLRRPATVLWHPATTAFLTSDICPF